VAFSRFITTRFSSGKRLGFRWRFSGLAQQAALFAAACCVIRGSIAVADDRGWELEPYRIRVVLAIDACGGLAERLAHGLPGYLRERVSAAIGPAWSFDAEVADGIVRHAVFAGTASDAAAPSPLFPPQEDKLLLVSLRATPLGYELTAREFDRFVQRWGVPIRREARQADMLAEQLFALVHRAVAPLARIELDANDAKRVLLHPRAAGLFRSIARVPFSVSW
jgi:hypothetical protein